MAAPDSFFGKRYLLYLAIAGFVGVVTVAIRELIGLLLGNDTPMHYAVSVLVAYGCGIALNYLCQARFTFRMTSSAHLKTHSSWRFFTFAVVAIATSLLTALLSHLLRYHAGFDAALGSWGSASAFATAALITSIVSYSVNARYIFSGSH